MMIRRTGALILALGLLAPRSPRLLPPAVPEARMLRAWLDTCSGIGTSHRPVGGAGSVTVLDIGHLGAEHGSTP
jgi:hypothetical protein